MSRVGAVRHVGFVAERDLRIARALGTQEFVHRDVEGRVLVVVPVLEILEGTVTTQQGTPPGARQQVPCVARERITGMIRPARCADVFAADEQFLSVGIRRIARGHIVELDTVPLGRRKHSAVGARDGVATDFRLAG